MTSLALCFRVQAFRTLRNRVWHQYLHSSSYIADNNPNDIYNGESSKNALISWYPGHIAKAERELADYLKKVDVVIEVRDARIPFSTTHPSVPSWIGNKPLIVAINRIDQISDKALREWKEYYTVNKAYSNTNSTSKVYFLDGKMGAGIISLKKEALKVGNSINEKRMKRGIQPRAVRAAIIGYPNVGKSAIINRLLGKKMAKSKNLPGVTKKLQWVRLGGSENSGEGSIELLDSPGIIPAKQFDQLAALKLAICNDIGEASYDRVNVATAMCDEINKLHRSTRGYVNMNAIVSRYDLPNFSDMNGEEIVYEIAERYCQGNSISAADKLLGDFRKNMLGWGSLEYPTIDRSKQTVKEDTNIITKDTTNTNTTKKVNNLDDNNLDVGKGNYEGW